MLGLRFYRCSASAWFASVTIFADLGERGREGVPPLKRGYGFNLILSHLTSRRLLCLLAPGSQLSQYLRIQTVRICYCRESKARFIMACPTYRNVGFANSMAVPERFLHVVDDDCWCAGSELSAICLLSGL